MFLVVVVVVVVAVGGARRLGRAKWKYPNGNAFGEWGGGLQKHGRFNCANGDCHVPACCRAGTGPSVQAGFAPNHAVGSPRRSVGTG